MDTNVLAHVFGLQMQRDEEGWKQMNWDEDDSDKVVWPAYLFLALFVVGVLWLVYDSPLRGAQ